MINFYKVWKEDKDNEPKKPLLGSKKVVCPLCLNRYRSEEGLKSHFTSDHKDGTLWKSYLRAKKRLAELPVLQLRSFMLEKENEL